MNNFEEIVKNFKDGLIGVFPTDTAFGVGCRMDDPVAVTKVYELRNRDYEKALIVLVGSLEMAKEYVFIDDKVEDKILQKYWPGGLTVVFKCKTQKVLPIVRAKSDTLAVRFPNNKSLVDVINKIGVPIVAPSANFSSEATPLRLSDVDPKLLGMVDFKVDGVCTMEGVSTILDVVSEPYKILRQGVVDVKI